MSEQPLREVMERLGIHLQEIEEVEVGSRGSIQPGKDHRRADFVIKGELGKLASAEILQEVGEIALAKWSDNPAVKDLYDKLLATIRMTDVQ